jgi:hypothetical protein
MEQTIQKPPLPTKTKIAAWWMKKSDRKNFWKIAS